MDGKWYVIWTLVRWIAVQTDAYGSFRILNSTRTPYDEDGYDYDGYNDARAGSPERYDFTFVL